MADSPPSRGILGRLKRLASRVKASLKKRLSKSSKRDSRGQQSAPTEPTVQQPATAATPPPPTTTEPSESVRATPQQPSDSERRLAFHTTIDTEKVQAIFAKYGIDLDGENLVISHVSHLGERVEKPIRMRVRRQCHNCQTGFTKTLVCGQCGHRYCRDCQRYPPKKSKKSDPSGAVAAKEDDSTPQPVEPSSAVH